QACPGPRLRVPARPWPTPPRAPAPPPGPGPPPPRHTGARLIHISTVAVYGRAAVFKAGEQRVTEDYPFQPLSAKDFYARTKRAAEQLVQQEAARGGVSVIAIRPNVIYGERDRLFTRCVIASLRRWFLPPIGP